MACAGGAAGWGHCGRRRRDDCEEAGGAYWGRIQGRSEDWRVLGRDAGAGELEKDIWGVEHVPEGYVVHM